MTARLKRWADQSGFVLLLLAAGALLFRPADLFPALEGVPIYESVVLLCIFASLPRLAAHLRVASARLNAVVALALMLAPAVALSHIWHGRLYEARHGGFEMLKACTLLVLMIVTIDTSAKFHATLMAIVSAVFAVTLLAVLQYHELVHLSGLQTVTGRSMDPDHPELIRLCGVGVFNDPNDFSLILVTAATICGHGLTQRPTTLMRLALVLPLGLFAYALVLTHSRGGAMSAVAAVLAYLAARFGKRNAIPLACLVVPLLLMALEGRQTSINLDDPEDTFQSRLALWSDSLEAFRSSPLLGIGQGRLAEDIGQVTHNSYLHAFAEMGLFGGIAFIGAFYVVLRGSWKAAPEDRELKRWRPYITAMTFGYGTGLLSLSRCYTVPTQLMLALPTVFMMLASRTGPLAVPRLNWALARRISAIGVAFLGATYVFVRLMLHR